MTPLAPRCPTKVDLEHLGGMLAAELLLCFDGPIVLKGTFGCGGCGGSGGPDAKPSWLANPIYGPNLRKRWGDDGTPITIYFDPSGPEQPRGGSIIRVTVHVDDQAAQRCRLDYSNERPPFASPDEIAIPYCRERLVVESYTILGRDPNYSG